MVKEVVIMIITEDTMDFLEAIMTRCSIRKYTGEKINEAQWETIFRAGFAAPSAHNLQPWHFIRIDDDALLEKIAESHPYAKMLSQSGGAILTCADFNIQQTEGFAVEDCSAAIQNMLITINGLELGGVWIGIYPIEALIEMMRSLFNLPEHIVPIGLMAVGHKATTRRPIEKYDEAKIHKNGW